MMNDHVRMTMINKAFNAVISEEPHGFNANLTFPASPLEQRKIIGDILIGSSTNWKEETLQVLDHIWNQETTSPSHHNRRTSILHLSPTTEWENTQIVVWQGDITKLDGVDSIVNAANDQGLGCFVPNHKCVDNIIHRAAGPRLRQACKEEMDKRTQLLTTGTRPIVTPGFHLPSEFVIHVTGPQVRRGSRSITKSEKQALSKTYTNVLDVAAEKNLRSVAFPCISTGLFGFPQEEAAKTVLEAVRAWVFEHPSTSVSTIVFVTYLDEDFGLYQQHLSKQMTEMVTNSPSFKGKEVGAVDLAKMWIDQADSVLVVAGAGMSVKSGEMVYTNPDDFARHYPFFPKWGYRTSYECMGLSMDRSIPETAKWALHAKHMDNMRWKFTPNQGYDALLDLVSDKDYFVLTSNVDGCFERTGFAAERIYTPQGEWTYLQCMKPCRSDSVFPARPYLDAILPHVSEDGYIPENLVPRCPRCQAPMFGNVRGGSWFLHHAKYEEQNLKLQSWMQDQLDSNRRVVVLEIGAGFNTPTVTRIPSETFVRSLGHNGRLVRINPSDPEVPSDLQSIALAEGWQALLEIRDSGTVATFQADLEKAVSEAQVAEGLVTPELYTEQVRRHFGRDGWRRLLQQLRSRRW